MIKIDISFNGTAVIVEHVCVSLDGDVATLSTIWMAQPDNRTVS